MRLDGTLKPILDVYEEDKGKKDLKSQVSLIRKELVNLTGNHAYAVILNQLLYWTQRRKDFSLMLEEEKNMKDKTTQPNHGWIYKTAEELNQDTLLSLDRTTIRRYLNFLVKRGWIFERSNPHHKWDRTTQYRVNIRKIQEDLLDLSLNLPEVSLWGLEERFSRERSKQDQSPQDKGHVSNVYVFPSRRDPADSRRQPPLKAAEIPNGQCAHSNEQTALSKGQIAPSNTETTTENTNREHTQGARANFKNENNFLESVLAVWKAHIHQEVQLTGSRRIRLKALLKQQCQSDLTQWEAFCKRIAGSPFLMGEGTRRWKVSFDWILVEENALKIREGNFDDPKDVEKRKELEAKHLTEQKKDTLLNEIQDPQWKAWCKALKGSLNVFELEDLKEVKFDEFDGRLVVVTSSSLKALNRVESLRLLLIPLIQQTYPKARNIITRRDSQKRCDPGVIHKEGGSECYLNPPSDKAESLVNVSIPSFSCKDKAWERNRQEDPLTENRVVSLNSINSGKRKEKVC